MQQRRVRTWAEFGQIRRDEEAKANERMAHLTGICPKCGDEGWWIDDDGGPYPGTFHYCDCQEGVRRQAEAEAEDEQLAATQRP